MIVAIKQLPRWFVERCQRRNASQANPAPPPVMVKGETPVVPSPVSDTQRHFTILPRRRRPPRTE
jgi:hypothetical protein